MRCTGTWKLFSAPISSLHNSTPHTPRMEINPPKTVCRCPSTVVIEKDQTRGPLALCSAVVSEQLHTAVTPTRSAGQRHSSNKSQYLLHAVTVRPFTALLSCLARRIAGRKILDSNPIRVMWDFSALAGSCPELGVLQAQWEGWNHTAELHTLHGCVFESVALIT